MSLAIAKPLRRWTFARALRSSTHSTRAARINITFAKCFFTSDQWSSIQPHFIFIFFDFRPMSNNTLRNARIVFHINFFSFHYFAVFGTTSYKSAMKFYLLWAIIISHICIDISYRKHNNNKAKTKKKHRVNCVWFYKEIKFGKKERQRNWEVLLLYLFSADRHAICSNRLFVIWYYVTCMDMWIWIWCSKTFSAILFRSISQINWKMTPVSRM